MRAILWDELELRPTIQIKLGTRRRLDPLRPVEGSRPGRPRYRGQEVELEGRWEELDGGGSLLRLRLVNRASESIRVTRLTFPTENGLAAFIGDFRPEKISFMRNGYQSWSTARSYRLREKPLRPWLLLVSSASSNLANLPSNHPGILSSEMYSVITDAERGQSFLVGQGAPFNQFLYIKLNLYRGRKRTSHFELQYDFGRRMIEPGERIELDRIVMMKGETHALMARYFALVKSEMRLRRPGKNVRGWCTWYSYHNRITPEAILRNVEIIASRKLDIDVIQIDDGYQRHVGDWLDPADPFKGRMRELADRIREAGYRPGIWIAPFAASLTSDLLRHHPDYVSRTERGKPIVCGYAPFWRGRLYYGLDITNPRFAEYIRRVIRTIVREWGFTYLKCDFLFTGALRESDPRDIGRSRAEILREGMRMIREEAGAGVTIVGCGMPLSTGIGAVDAMRIGPDTGPFWIKRVGRLLRTGAMVGVRNSMRNVMVRSAMNKNLWLNDPDCLMVRKARTSLSPEERMSQINAIILSGGALVFSDDFSSLSADAMEEAAKIGRLSNACFRGTAVAVDLMEREIPQIFYNTAGFLGLFNPTERRQTIEVRLETLPWAKGRYAHIVPYDVWSGRPYPLRDGSTLVAHRMPRHSSILLTLRGMPFP